MQLDLPDTDPRERATARQLWAHLEVVHTPVYFAPAVHDALDALGLPRPTGGYTASRIAGAGAVTPHTALAAFYGFAPAFVHAALPAAWEVATPQQVLDTTLDAVDRTLAPLVAHLDLDRAAELAREVAELHPIAGRPMAASRAGVPWPDAPHLVLWEAATRIREARGDGHHAVLLAAGIDGCAAHLTAQGDSAAVRAATKDRRGWSDPEWQAAIARLQARGLLAADATLTDEGRRFRGRLEEATDAVAAPPWVAFGDEPTGQLHRSLGPVVTAIASAGFLPDRVTARVTVGDG